MKLLRVSAFLVLGVTITFTVTSTALAGVTAPVLANWAFNLNGTVYESLPPSSGGFLPPKSPPTAPAPPGSYPDPLPDYVDYSDFDFWTGLGAIEMTINTPGENNIIAFFDHDIIPSVFNLDDAMISGVQAPGQSWNIGDPVDGYIYPLVTIGSLDNTQDPPQGTLTDVSMAMGWNFFLGDGDIASINFYVQQIANGFAASFNGGPYLTINQSFLGSQQEIAFTSMLNIQKAEPIPEPATLFLLGTGLAGVAGAARRRKQK